MYVLRRTPRAGAGRRVAGRALGVVTLCTASAVWMAPAAQAESSSQLRAKAARLADQIERTGRELERLVESYNEARFEASGLDDKLAVSTAQVGRMETRLDGLRAGVRDFAVRMFASGNQSGGVGELLGGSSRLTDTIVKDQLGALALTNGQQLTSDLASTLDDLNTAQARLTKQKQAKARLLATLQARQSAAETKQKQLIALQNSTNTALKQALAVEQARRDAAAARPPRPA